MGVSMIEEYRKTLSGLFTLLERKREMLRGKQMDVGEYNRIKHHIHVIQKEIYEVQDILRQLERSGSHDRNVRYGYRRRMDSNLYDGADDRADFGENAQKSAWEEIREKYADER